MPNIFYQKKSDGIEYATWPGKSVRNKNTIKKTGQIYLGKVIDKNNLIFFSSKHGYFKFNPADQSCSTVDASMIPIVRTSPDLRLHPSMTTMRFGGSFFLHCLIFRIEYNKVIDKIRFQNRDTLYGMFQYYLLTNTADMHADRWYLNSFARFLYPKANLYSQRISDLYKAIGTSDNRLAFLEAHIRYVLESTDDECCIIIDSTGCQNACSVPITKVSRHENEINIEFRVILVVQRSTGLPLYYEVIPGNVVDISTLNRVKKMLAALGLRVTDVLGDAGYACPSNMERLIFAGTNFMMRLNPTYNLYKKVLIDNKDKLDTAKTIQYRNRDVKVLKVPSVIAKDKSTGEDVNGFVYLCRDMEAYHTKSAQLYVRNKKKKDKGMKSEEVEKACEILGIFAIVDTRDLSEEDVLPEYYMRQGVEQFFDSAKNYGRMMPVRNHNIETISGHMMISFITTFLCVLIKNRMNIMDSAYSAVPAQLQKAISENDEVVSIDGDNAEKVIVQTPIPDVFESSPGALFAELELMNGTYFPEDKTKDRKEQIIPDTPQKEANEFMEAFGLVFPEGIEIGENGKLIPIYDEQAKETCTRAKAFARKPVSTDETIEKKRKKLSKKESKQSERKPAEEEASAVEKRKPGRPKGSKNKKTLEREAELAKLKAEGRLPMKRGRGRPRKNDENNAGNA